MMAEKPQGVNDSRGGSRTPVQIQVEVDVAGAKQIVILTTRDIGTGGVYLRTSEPAPLWKRVSITIEDPKGKTLEIAGEVVRRMTTEQDKATNYSPGMAVAFDEMSRGKHKELAALVTRLAATEQVAPKVEAQPTPPPQPQPTADPTPPQETPDTPKAAPASNPAAMPAEKKPAESDSVESKADKLLEELDALLSMDD